MVRAIAILIEPCGAEHFITHGPDSDKREEALRFLNAFVATKAACSRIYGYRDAFWNSERTHAENTRREHRGWSYRVEEVGGV
jgi:hypothetical protein